MPCETPPVAAEKAVGDAGQGESCRRVRMLHASANPAAAAAAPGSKRQRLEQRAHLRRRSAARARASIAAALVGMRPASAAPPALAMPRSRQERALRRSGPARRGAAALGRRRQRREIDMGGEIGFARLGQQIGECVRRPPPAGSRRSRRRRHSHNRRSARRRRARRRCGRCLRPGRWRPARFHRRRPSGVAARLAGIDGRRQPASGASAKSSSPSLRRHHALVPAPLGLHILADRQRVEEFVGDEQQRPVRRGCHRSCALPAHGAPLSCQRRALHVAQAPDWLRPAPRRRRARNPAPRSLARSMSAISVPRPGPSSTSARRLARPDRARPARSHSPISSPNIWLISGAVMKSPPRRTDRASRNSRARGSCSASVMNCATEIGPCASISRAMRSPSAFMPRLRRLR